jgi:hypothetical protein
MSGWPGLQWFRNIALVSSNQDQYVPFDSARIQLCMEAISDPKGQHYIQMCYNLMHEVKAKIVYRLDVDFSIEAK